MFEEMDAIFSKFAEEHNLIYKFTKHDGFWFLTFYNQDRTWAYRREICPHYLSSDVNEARWFAEQALVKVRLKMQFYHIV